MTLNIERNGNTLADAEPAVTKLVWSQSLLPVFGDTGGLSRSEPSLSPCSCCQSQGFWLESGTSWNGPFSCHTEHYMASHLAQTCSSAPDKLHSRRASGHQSHRDWQLGVPNSWALTYYPFQKSRVQHGRLRALFYFKRERGCSLCMNNQKSNAFSSFSGFQKIYIPSNPRLVTNISLKKWWAWWFMAQSWLPSKRIIRHSGPKNVSLCHIHRYTFFLSLSLSLSVFSQ